MNSNAKIIEYQALVQNRANVDQMNNAMKNRDTSLRDAYELIGKSLGIEVYSGYNSHKHINGDSLQESSDLENMEWQVNYMSLKLKQAVPMFSVLFVMINFALFSSGLTMWMIYKLAGVCLINPITLFFINFGTFGLTVTGFTSMWEWRDYNGKKEQEWGRR